MSFSRVARRITVSTASTPHLVDHPVSLVMETPLGSELRTRSRATAHLSADQYVNLLAFIEEEGGAATLDAISRALPLVSQPVSAVFDLCDAGILNVDWETAFDGDMRVWRVD